MYFKVLSPANAELRFLIYEVKILREVNLFFGG